MIENFIGNTRVATYFNMVPGHYRGFYGGLTFGTTSQDSVTSVFGGNSYADLIGVTS